VVSKGLSFAATRLSTFHAETTAYAVGYSLSLLRSYSRTLSKDELEPSRP